jgi:hypothetical protein
MTKPSSILSAIVVALAVALGGAACTGNPSPQEAGLTNDQPSTVVSESTDSAVPPTSDPIDTACASNPSSQDAGLPNYQPSTVVSESRGATVLRTSDPIDKVSAYYINLIDTGGWQTVSRTVTGHAANLVVKKSGQGAAITISSNPAGPQTLIVVATYPTA